MRLEKSLRLLRSLNESRALRNPRLVEKYEALLRQHDADIRNKTDPHQTSIYDAICRPDDDHHDP